MRFSYILFGGITALIFVSVIIYAASTVTVLQQPQDFDTRSTAWNGLSKLASVVSPTILENLSALPPAGLGYTLMVMGPFSDFSSAQAVQVARFVNNGGNLVVAEDFGSANTLLRGMRLNTRFTQDLLKDPLFNSKNSYFPIAPGVHMKNVSGLALDYATILSVADPSAQVIAWSSSFSYLSPNQNSQPSNSPTGPFPVVVQIPYGNGEITLIADSSVFINSMIDLKGNLAFLRGVTSGRLLLDTSHWSPGLAAEARNFEITLYGYMGIPEVKYSAVAFGVAAILIMRFNERREASEVDELESVMQQHPDWDRQRLSKLEEELVNERN
jgi:hypothetical protein